MPTSVIHVALRHLARRLTTPPAMAGLCALVVLFAWFAAPPASAAASSASVTVPTCDENGLRTAIANAAPGDTVDFSCGGTITLTAAGGGPIILDKDLTIDGSGQAVTISGGGSVAVFEVASGATVTLRGLTVADGFYDAGSGGANGAGGVVNHGTLHVVDSIFRGNTGTSAGIPTAAGAIYDAGALDVIGSTFSGNRAGGNLSAGGVYSASGHVMVTASTFSGNSGVQAGGIVANGGTLSMVNSTFSGNAAGWNLTTGSGGAVFSTGLAAVSVTNSTLTGNSTAGASQSTDADGGIYLDLAMPAPVSLTNSVVAGNVIVLSGYTIPANCGPLSVSDHGGNFSDDNSCTGAANASAAALNLEPLADNGGPTPTVALGPGSVAIDAASCLQATDQRGLPRPGAGGAACDSGAYESQGTTDNDLALAGVPNDIVVYATSSSGATVSYTAPTAVDEPGDASPAAVSCSPTSGSTFPLGTTTVTCTATDTDDLVSRVSATFTVTVNPEWTLTAVSGSGTYGGTGTLTATLRYGSTAFAGEVVAFTVNGGNFGATTDGNGVATVSGVDLAGIDAGSHPGAVAAYSIRTSNTVTGTLTVAAGDQTIAVTTAAPSSADDGSSFTVAATASSGLPVAYTTGGSCTNSGATITITGGSGTCTVTYTQAGNGSYNAAAQVTETVDAVAVDTTPPADAPVVTGTAGDDGWYRSDVSVAWHWTDTGAGIDSSRCTQSSISTGEGATVVVSSTCTDLAGNTATDELALKIDQSKPIVTAAATSLPNENGWYRGDVVVHFTCADAGSGIPAGACPDDQTLSPEGAGISSVAETVTDGAGNSSAPSNVVTVQIDKTPPTIGDDGTGQAPTGNDGTRDWYDHEVAVDFSATDGLSGLAGSCQPSWTATTSGEGIGVTASSGACADKAGNGNQGIASSGYNVDTTKPVVSVTGVSDGATYTVGSVPAAGCGTADALSGVKTSATPRISGGPVGSFTATCSGASDNAGNTNSASVTYTVIYTFSGFFLPVDSPPACNLAKAGSAIPVVFSLGGDQGLNIIAAGYPTVGPGTCAGGTTSTIDDASTGGESGLDYDPTTDRYTYVWKTDKAWRGQAKQLTIVLADGTTHTAEFSFTK